MNPKEAIAEVERMSEEAKAEGAKDANTRDQMQEVAHAVNELIPQGWGFFVLVFPFNDAPGRMNYVSNAKREDVLKMMLEFIKKSEADPRTGHH